MLTSHLNISLSRSGSLALLDFPLSVADLGLPWGVVTSDLEFAGVVERTREGVKGSGGSELLLLRLLLDILNEQELSGAGTLRLEERDCLPELFWIKLIPKRDINIIINYIKNIIKITW